jgi:pimeloyl-ACP methyl ester carboxylesterase
MSRKSLVAVSLAIALLPSVAFAARKSPPAPRVIENSVLRVEVSGKGRPMLFVPGLTCGGDVWRDAVAHFAGRYQCHVVTLGGFAGKPRFEGPFLDTARDSLLAYLRAGRLESPVIVGHSLGGVLAMELAIAAPDAIGPLVVVDALPFLGGTRDTAATEESARKAMEPMRQMIRGQTQEAYAAYQSQAPYLRSMVAPGPNYDRVLQWASTSDHITVADAMFEVGTRDLRAKIAAVRSPVLVLGSWYGYKEYSTRAAVEATFRTQYAKAPHWTLALADTARHFVMLDSPEWTWARIDAFLAGDATASANRGGR